MGGGYNIKQDKTSKSKLEKSYEELVEIIDALFQKVEEKVEVKTEEEEVKVEEEKPEEVRD